MTAAARKAFPVQVGGSRLGALFAEISSAVEEGRLQAAARLGDCACRAAPKNLSCLLLQAQLLIRLGAASEAIERLRGRDGPDAIAIHAEAFLQQSLYREAAESVETLLRRFALDSVADVEHLAARVCRAQNEFPGWVGVDSRLRLRGEVWAGNRVDVEVANRVFHPETRISNGGFDSLEFELPKEALGPVKISTGGLQLLGSGIGWPIRFGFFGWVLAEDEALTGRVLLEWAPRLPITLAVTPSGGGSQFRVPVAATPLDSTPQLFRIPSGYLGPGAGVVEVSAVLPDGKHMPLAGSPVRLKSVLPAPIRARPVRVFPAEPDRELGPKIVDVVVPVYAGLEETLVCLERVLATTVRSEAEVVVVNDASPDLELCAALDRFMKDDRITLLTDSSNLGFPGAANRGINLHPERDVVLLNSDAVVFGDWLGRLKSAAYNADDIGTVTPFGEFASIVSYPGNSGRPQTMEEAAEIDRIAREVNAGKVVELPVGVGFCLYIKRSCLTEAGGLDEETFGNGYGEENDFCLRSRRLGWRHVGATDLFVGHRGGRSYGRRKEMLLERNRRVLESLHPGYEAVIDSFVTADPLLDARRAIDTRRLLKHVKNPVLFVTLELPGGVKRYVDLRQTQLQAAGQPVLVLQPSETSRSLHQTLLISQNPVFENLAYNLPEETAVLQALLSDLGLTHIELHHFAGLPQAALELVVNLGVPYDVYVHDYSWVCPRVRFLGGNGSYCGEPPIKECEECIQRHGSELDESLTVAALRSRSDRILRGARAVIAPSNDVRTRLSRYFPSLPVQVVPWEPRPIQLASPSRPAVSERIRVAVIGAISVHKGHRILLECARNAADRNLNLDFILIGYTCDDESLLATGRVFITGPYADREIDTLLEREQCHIAFFPAATPETWCYALTHVMRWNLPIVAFDLGAISERLRSYVAAELLPLSAAAPDINDSLLRLTRSTNISEAQKEFDVNDTLSTSDPRSVPQMSQELETSAKLLTLPVGAYAFTVQGGAALTLTGELALPALQVGIAPTRSAGTVEFLAGAATLDRWLTRSSDIIIVRIAGDSASLLLTSVRRQDSPVLSVDIRRLESPEFQAAQTVANGHRIPTQILAHIKNFGDVQFGDGWAGFLGAKLWIEAFAVMPAGPLPADLIEYCGVTADGFQTPWLSNQMLCGSRGRGMPITGFAVRIKPEASDRYDCAYSGRFLSGSMRGPFRDGALCCSEAPGDPLEGLDVQITARVRSEVGAPEQPVEYSETR